MKLTDIETDTPMKNKQELRDKFRDFFIFHNEANKNTVAVDEYFNEWYDTRYREEQKQIKSKKNECKSSESPDGKHRRVACSCDPTEGYCCDFCGQELF